MGNEKEASAFVERIGKRLSDSPRASRSGWHRVAFIALRPLIEAALAHGYTMKATWAALHDEKKLSMSYQTFRMHCRREGIGRPDPAAVPTSHLKPESRQLAGAVTDSSPGVSPGLGDHGSTDASPRAFRHSRMPRTERLY